VVCIRGLRCSQSQSRAGRALLDRSREKPVDVSRVGLRTIVDVERGARAARGHAVGPSSSFGDSRYYLH
jgi:hypothetical protein